jgi:hypothetical protein
VHLSHKKAKQTAHVDEEVDEGQDKDEPEVVDVLGSNDEHEGCRDDHDEVLCTNDNVDQSLTCHREGTLKTDIALRFHHLVMKKESTKDLLTIFSDLVTMKFKKGEVYETLKG